ncbi:MAG: terpene cyclase/mutase family protein [Planctomycetes bacterium]|nr:terpene cyclase/mutase family protein [Planctomycetota bacterium]
MQYLTKNLTLQLATVLLVCGFAAPLDAQPKDDLLTPAKWQQVDTSVERALLWLASQQQRNGSFPTLTQGQPGVTSLCVMAFVAHGHLPGEGPYGEQLDRALEFIVSCQKPSGLLALVGPGGKTISRNVSHSIGSAASYNHAFSALLLSEVFAMGGGDLQQNQTAIERAVQATLVMQRWPKRRKTDKGGWRYINRFDEDGLHDSDLSVTGWHLMFLRSAKNAGFEVPKETIDNAVAYVHRCFQPKFQTFLMFAGPEDSRSRGMAGAGILALAHAGHHDSKEARLAGDWLLKEGFANYNESRHFNSDSWTDDRYHYGVFCASQAMYQLGGDHWSQFYPPTVKVILQNQGQRGNWAADVHYSDGKFGNSYTTALMVLTLGAPNQLLPIFQR